MFESGAILLHLAEKFGAFLPTDGQARAECLSWLFWQMGSAPYLGGGFGHFYAYAPTKIEYAIDRFAMEVKRQLDVLDRRLADNEYPGGRANTRSPIWRSGPGTARSPRAWSTARASSCRCRNTRTSALDRCDRQTPGGEARPHGQPHLGRPASQLHERHDASDFDTKTQDKIGEPAKG